jgi:hypothetical protein
MYGGNLPTISSFITFYVTHIYPCVCVCVCVCVRDTRRITATEMKYMRKTVRYSWTDHKTNTESVNELNISQALDKTKNTEKKNLLQHTNRTTRNRLP